ncbi:dephospho-CoA kinase [Syntrophomonas palmitatica]|uniref:dephospho-CoA kinase n=1 Tax=Syntrophomonas palmitatica TaxID=402877 RepID=UPI0006D287DD|nr:dephospho-CoA kinase [Syntrophomonas palmitatica]
MYIIGLTGGIASGKSTITIALRELGAEIINADEISHRIIEPDQPAWQDIAASFGKEVLNEDLSINRAALGAIVFSDPARLQELNHITHPRVMERLRFELDAIRQKNPDAIVVMEIPLLYETHMDRLCNEVWVVWVDRETQIKRLMNRDQINYEDAVKRIDSQMPLDEKAARADRVIDNMLSVEETKVLATRYYIEIKQRDSSIN